MNAFASPYEYGSFAAFNRQGNRLLYGIGKQPLVVFDVLTEEQMGGAPVKVRLIRPDIPFLPSDGTRCVSLEKTVNWSSPHRRTTVSTSGHCPTAKDATSPSTSRSSPCVDTLMSSPSATTTTTTSWLLLVPKRSSNCGPPSPDKIFVTNQDGDLHFFSFSFSFSFLKFVSRLSLKTQKRRISIINVNLIILN